ncbi:two-component system, NarL family, sensor histidine kinase DesK [Tessaracoccus bendigoensis DSM 12906]|uniref:Two-component system, NarL family, sensor histidine kinase DesK n=1 Tax=Tessaracoccus bendigoensis DSM 12906 TaxID=1123357 RepID=A0A1M6M704_9ACTN|nr:sensor histidine kinase [Tessaracoccus bendigoensis]SHJ79190.1 two-component system, NarL family, sensor histidine kinase DesK [Tessaracoccus bendigoensis DSM 12906]
MDRPAPGYAPEACELSWWRRGLAQGAGYMFPSLSFLFIPIFLLRDTPHIVVTTVLITLIGALSTGTSWIMHTTETIRWLWLFGLMLLIVAVGVVTDGDAKPAYFVAFPAAVAAVLLPWTDARLVILVIALLGGGYSLVEGDAFGVVLAVTAATIGITIGATLEAQHTRRQLELAEERTAVLAVAAERERIGRDLHDILGHSLTTIAVKADLAERLIGRDDDALRTEIRQLAEIARQSLSDVRATASGMREVRLGPELAAARAVLLAAGVAPITPRSLPQLGDDTSELFGYVVREGVTNVVRHADATRCVIECDSSGISVADDGVGITGPGEGSGIAGLRTRLDAAGGTFEVESTPQGTRITARLGTTP